MEVLSWKTDPEKNDDFLQWIVNRELFEIDVKFQSFALEKSTTKTESTYKGTHLFFGVSRH